MVQMADNIRELRPKPADSEKITINLGYVDLGHIDLLVQEGFYSNRTDFIRTAIRNQLATHGEEVRKSIVRHTLELGLQSKTANASLCWNWFSPENQMRGRGEPAIIAGITSEIV